MTINDVAKAAGVSKATVSRVINSPHLVNDETVKKVRAVMKKLNFIPNAVAQSMRLQRTKTVGVVIPDPRNPFYSGMLCAIEIELKKRDYMMIICPSSGEFDEEKRYLARMLQRRVDGIVFFTYNNSKAHMDYFGKLIGNTPFVLMDESREDLDVNLVATNGYGGIKEAVRYFIDCGHSRIGCLYGKTEAGTNRYCGYIDALKESGFEVRAKYVRQCDFSIESGYEAGKKLLALEKRPSAVICVADSIAVGFLKCMIESGIRVPDEMEVMGFDNIGMSMVISPQLSTISQNFEMLSKQAIHILMEVIDEPNKIRVRKKELIKGEIIFRQSTKRPGTDVLSDVEYTDMPEKKRK